MTKRFVQVPRCSILPRLRDRGFVYQFVYAPGEGGWIAALEQVVEWYASNYHDPNRENVDVYGRAVFFTDPDVAFAFKMRFC